MAISEKVKEKIDSAGKEIMESIEALKGEVAGLTRKVKERLSGTGDDLKEASEELSKQVKDLADKVRSLVSQKMKSKNIPIRVEKTDQISSGGWEQPFLELQRATNRLFDNFFRDVNRMWDPWADPFALTTDSFGLQWPRVDISESDNVVVIMAELPGVDEDDLEVSVSGNRVTIRGEKRQEEEQGDRNYYHAECSYGSFQRTFTLPMEIDFEKIDAFFKQGVLTVRLPKTAATRGKIKKIPVKAV
jgi:HSP20 family protein